MPYLSDLLNDRFNKYVTDNIETLAEEYEVESGFEKYVTIREWEKGNRDELFVEWARLEWEEKEKPL